MAKWCVACSHRVRIKYLYCNVNKTRLVQLQTLIYIVFVRSREQLMIQQPVPLAKQYLHWIYWKTTLRYFNWGLCPHQFYSQITCYVHVCLINHSHFTYKRKLLKYLITGKVLHVLYIIFRVQTYKIQIHNIKLVTDAHFGKRRLNNKYYNDGQSFSLTSRLFFQLILV